MAEKRDYYEVLGVERAATEGQLSEAYRQAGAEVSSRPQSGRRGGDRQVQGGGRGLRGPQPSGEAGPLRPLRARRPGRGRRAAVPRRRDIFQAFGDIFGEGFFGDFFGGRDGAAASTRARTSAATSISDLLEAAKGTVKSCRFARHVACETCGGSGAKPGTQPEPCRYCGGRGRVVQAERHLLAANHLPLLPRQRKVIRELCSGCRGTGFVQRKITRKVDIPAGVDNQTRLRLRGEGEPSPTGGPPGDCYCFIHVAEHPLFHREGRDLVCQVPISYSQAALGATIEVPTLDGCEEVTIPAGTQPGDVS